MNYPETLTIKLVDVFLRFPTDICMPHSGKQSNGYGHGETTWGEFLTEIWERIEFLKMEEDLVWEWNQYNKLGDRSMLWDLSLSTIMQNLERGALELWSFLNGNDQQ
jgi:hypothetical protein